MSGGSYAHALIATNINSEIRNRLKGKPCRILDANMRIATPRRMFYADGTVVCGQPQFDPRDSSNQSLANPRVIIEVLSPSTESYDKKDKFDHYAAVQSIEEYILVYQDEPRVEGYLRQGDGTWSYAIATGLDAVVQLRCIQIEVSLSEIYNGVEFPPPAIA